MRLSIKDICTFAECSPSTRNFIEGENLLNCGHLLSCGKTEETEDCINLLGFCLQISNMRDPPHKITIKLDIDGKINLAECTCKAGLSAKCKHIVAMLLFCNRKEIEQLDQISCTDQKCIWNLPHTAALDTYKTVPLVEHKCFKVEEVKVNEKSSFINSKLCTISSSYTMHLCGRHSPKEKTSSEANFSLSATFPEIDAIVRNLPSIQMLELSNMSLDIPLKACCTARVNTFSKDIVNLCIETKRSRTLWKKERQFRITGSRCYHLLTYSKNKNPDWQQKSLKYFYPKEFTTNMLDTG